MLTPTEGTVLAGKYALKSKLGQGGMGSVWRAEHVQLRSPVAIKLIDPQIASDPEALARFMREAQSAAALRSPNVVQIFDFGADQGAPYIAMELLEGESLATRLERTRMLSPMETSHIVTQVARAVARAHEAGIVHRDLKPDNVFLVRHDEEEIAKVLDFGIAKATNPLGAPAASATRTGAVLGTPHYMSPEQAEGKPVDFRTDLWALGVIAFECLLGRRPFDSDALGALLISICTRPLPVPSSHGSVPFGFDAWFARACARAADERFQSARELAVELRLVCGDGARESQARLGASSSGPPEAPRITPPPAERPPTARAYERSVSPEKPGGRVAAVVLGGAIALVAMSGGVAFVMKQRHESSPAEAARSANREEPAPTFASPVEPPPVIAPVESTAPATPAVPTPSAAVPSGQPRKQRAPAPVTPAAKAKAPAEPSAKPPKVPSGDVDVLGI